MARHVSPPRLLQLDDGALRFELLFDLFGFLLGHAFLRGAGRAFDQVLGLLQAQVGNRPDLLDDLDLLLSAGLEDDRELGLFLGGGRGRATPRAGARRRGCAAAGAEIVTPDFSLNASISSANSNTDMFPMASRMSSLRKLV